MGDPSSPRDSFVGGGMRMLVDIAVDPAATSGSGNNWQDCQAGIEWAEEARSTLDAGQGRVVFYGIARMARGYRA